MKLVDRSEMEQLLWNGVIWVYFGAEFKQYICNHARGFSSEQICRKLNLAEKGLKLFPHTIPITIL